MSRRRRNPATARALALLTVTPIPATQAELPRFHLSRIVDGTILLTDRVMDLRLAVYLPKTTAEFNGGHKGRSWYIREAAGAAVNTPVSRPFPGWREAIQAIADGSWDMLTSHADRKPIRVLWT